MGMTMKENMSDLLQLKYLYLWIDCTNSQIQETIKSSCSGVWGRCRKVDVPSSACWEWGLWGLVPSVIAKEGQVENDACLLRKRKKGKCLSPGISRNKDWRQVIPGNKLCWVSWQLFIREARRMVRSVKNANNITAAGVEECPASAKGRLNHITHSNPASNFPVLSGLLRSTFPEVIYWLLGVSLPWCGCLSKASRTEMLSDAQWEDFHLGPGILRCSGSSACWISHLWNADLAGDWASTASATGSKGRCNPGGAVDVFWV